MKRLLIIAATVAALALLFIIGANVWIVRQARPFIVTSGRELPDNDVALVLGTSAKGPRGYENPFFAGRVTTAAEMYRVGKAKHLLVSGDNSRRSYDEPTAMRDALVEKGVPAAAITLDYAGFRTLDSMARAKSVFGLQTFTIVTDDFHQARAVFLARSLGLDATGCPSRYVPMRWSKMVRAREIAARVVAFLDVYLLKTQPKFLGPPVELKITERPAK